MKMDPHPRTLSEILHDARCRAVIEALRATGGNRCRASARLGVSASYVLRLVTKLGLKDEIPQPRYFWGRHAEVDLAEARQLARHHSLWRAAELLGVHFRTLRKIAAQHAIQFTRKGDNDIRRKLGK